MTRIVIIGGGPAGYEAALVAAQLGADVTVIERDGVGGASVLTDCVPSKTLIAAAGAMTAVRDSAVLGLRGNDLGTVGLDLAAVNQRIKGLAVAQSADIHARLESEGVRLVSGQGRLSDEERGLAAHRVEVLDRAGTVVEELEGDVVLIATGADPRVLPGAEPDGERILSWRDVYDLEELPEHLVVVGSGVTGAEFASGYLEAGVPVTLVSSRDQVLPGEDADAAAVVEEVFQSRGGRIAERGRAEKVLRTEKGVRVELTDGRVVEGSHALMTVGTVPNTDGLNLEACGVEVTKAGHILVDRVSRTTVPGIYAAGDVTGVFQLASVAAMQGRIAMWHALGEAVAPIRLKTVAANVFTHPEIATVGVQEKSLTEGADVEVVRLPLATNARAKMGDLHDGFVKLYARRSTDVVIGGVVVAPGASELILPIALAVTKGLTAGDLAQTFAIYPSLSGSITEAGRRLMGIEDEHS
ncbi:Pyruvate/2-oxoglutarate dehydrogenase complex, dihydrolipoamide dehydrogenase component [Modestobacter italicus]|uniref:Pyruvate/2-oxoglutarate dehydrogenase complex, dihydrolipoamide dehydrogenase component n=1 Tax=Modestobacter italicus (strain DSM 44449 / CECT 9708 / BC 501) TaxID=2732864 RepID=I4F3E1_MODI5|nr:NAD(P)H-quinone dehydrogenase [Modestobacter marinus]CCH90154.1 Pyruvate/2-oxoglutarate dehydrogenase complex, dihydrolipoamide dehydrogenase component [Modestobacter marinus]